MTDEIPYLQLDPEIERAIREDRQNAHENPYRFLDDDVIRREENPHDDATLMRPAFARDIEKIMNVPAYNRLAGKTQVFSFVKNDDISRRGLHVQLVSRIARNIGRMLGLNLELIEAIALGHDVGHTPFGHAGEHFLSRCYNRRTGRYFNHNVHSVRVLDRLYRRNISLQTLDGVLCHNGEFATKKLICGTCDSFEDIDCTVETLNNDESLIKMLRPSTLEGCVVRVSDMIAYLGKDRQDALDMGVLDSLDVFDSTVIGRDNVHIINNITVSVINKSYGHDYIEMSQDVFDDLVLAKRQNYELIYDKEGMTNNAGNVVEDMFDTMYDKLLDDLKNDNESSPIFRHHIKSLVKKSRSITADTYLAQDPNQIVVDYMASMTDNYFLALYDYLFQPRETWIVMRDYCDDLKNPSMQ